MGFYDKNRFDASYEVYFVSGNKGSLSENRALDFTWKLSKSKYSELQARLESFMSSKTITRLTFKSAYSTVLRENNCVSWFGVHIICSFKSFFACRNRFVTTHRFVTSNLQSLLWATLLLLSLILLKEEYLASNFTKCLDSTDVLRS